MMSDVGRVETKNQPNFARLEERRVAEEFIFNWGITSDEVMIPKVDDPVEH